MHPSFPNAIPHESRNATISQLGGRALAWWPFPAKSLGFQGVPHKYPREARRPRCQQAAQSLWGCHHPTVSTTRPSHPHSTSLVSLLPCCSILAAAASCSFAPSVSSSWFVPPAQPPRALLLGSQLALVLWTHLPLSKQRETFPKHPFGAKA